MPERIVTVDNKVLIAFASAGVSLVSAYTAFLDSKDDPRRVVPGLMMMVFSAYLAYFQFKDAKQAYLIAQQQRKLGTVKLNQNIA